MAGEGVDPERLECAVLLRDISSPQGSYAKGGLYALVPNTHDSPDVLTVPLHDPTVTVELPRSFIRLIDHETRELLRSIPNPERRLLVSQDANWLEDGRNLQVGDQVLLYHAKPPLKNETGGVLRYKGPLNRQKGIHFGIELDPEHKGKGTSDGTFRKVSYFSCPDDCAVFVNIYHVRLNADTGIPSSAMSSLDIQYPPAAQRPRAAHREASNSSGPNSIEEKINAAVEQSESIPQNPPPLLGLPPPPRAQPQPVNLNLGGFPSSYGNREQPARQSTGPPKANSGSTSFTTSVNLQGPEEAACGDQPQVPLEIGERVVWVSDQGIHKGVVRWIGLPGELDEAERQVTAGVELDDPVGTGTGRYKGRDLFRVAKGHAALMPIMGLMKEDDFEGKSSVAAAAPAVRRQPSREANREEEDLKRAIEASLKDQQQTSSNSGSSRLNSFPSIKVPPVMHDQPASYIGEGVRRKKTGSKPVQQRNTSSSTAFALKTLENPFGLAIGSRVKFLKSKSGVIKWIGKSEFASDPDALMVGILMDRPDRTICTDGTFLGTRYFDAPPHSAFFYYLHKCKPGEPPAPPEQAVRESVAKASYGRSSSHEASSLTSLDSIVAVPESTTDLLQYIGRAKGIAGVDRLSGFVSLLYSWFQFSDALDSMLSRQQAQNDVQCFKPVREMLRNKILKPLRVSGKAFAEDIETLYAILANFGLNTMNTDLTKAFPEDYITLIVNRIFRHQLVKLSAGGSSSWPVDYLLVSPDTPSLRDVHFPTTKKVLQGEMVDKKFKFACVPSALHMVCKFERIHPLLEIDVGELVECVQQVCGNCRDDYATIQCYDCFSGLGGGDEDEGLAKTYFCETCASKAHSGPRYERHTPRRLPHTSSAAGPPQDCCLRLAAVVCHDQNRFVTYAKCHKGRDAPWVKFDSMASSIKSKDEGKKYVPDVAQVDYFARWLTPSRTVELAAMKRMDMSNDLQLLCLHTHLCLYVKE